MILKFLIRRGPGARPQSARPALARWASAVAAAGFLAGCGSSANHISVSHRHAPDGESRIVVLPVELPEGYVAPAGEGSTLGGLYATELLRSYDIFEFKRFEKLMMARELDLDTILENGAGQELVEELGIDGVLVSRVYDWKPGAPSFWFLSKPGRIGFLARLIDLRTGSVIWSANRVKETAPSEPLSVGIGTVFQDLAKEMPGNLAPY
ncbi:MAG: hypothetical protein HKN12_11355 [Gemmatimonadetes bacterium]|nr:hypothetical protein [Gemmatimonadota bacterium]